MRFPVKMLTAPAGRSQVARHSANATAVNGSVSDAIATTVFPATSGGTSVETSPSRPGASGATTPTTPTGSGAETLRVGPGDGIAGGDERRVLIAPAGEPDRPVDRRIDLAQRLALALADGAEARAEMVALRFDHLGEPVEDEPAVRRHPNRTTAGTLRAPPRLRPRDPCAKRARR